MGKQLSGRDELMHINPGILPLGPAIGIESLKFDPVKAAVTDLTQRQPHLDEGPPAHLHDRLAAHELGLLGFGEEVDDAENAVHARDGVLRGWRRTGLSDGHESIRRWEVFCRCVHGFWFSYSAIGPARMRSPMGLCQTLWQIGRREALRRR
jgi:hypothetical protein